MARPVVVKEKKISKGNRNLTGVVVHYAHDLGYGYINAGNERFGFKPDSFFPGEFPTRVIDQASAVRYLVGKRFSFTANDDNFACGMRLATLDIKTL
jgi:hypothetical protein